jgi:dihydroorotase
VRVTCEVTAHHFTLTDEDVAAANYHPNWKTNPPLRGRDDVEAVRQGLYDATVDAIVSNHAPYHSDEKELDFSEAPFGIVGLETTVGLAIDRLVHGRVIGLGQMVRLLSTRPAEIFSLPGGTLRTGAPADVTMLDLQRRWTVKPADFRSKSRNTPFGGRRLRGRAVATIVGGDIAWQL